VETGTGTFGLNLVDNVKRGPLCDATDHYFHRTACTPLFTSSDLCGGCHALERHDGSLDLSVHGEYAEWKAGPFGPGHGDLACQSCHMPARAGQIAEGWDGRDKFSDHQTLGDDDGLVTHALRLALRGTPTAGDGLALHLVVHNEGAGHAVPTGLPGRRVRVEVRTLAEDGAQLDRWTHEYGMFVVDDAGNVAPFYRATRVERDDRIAPGTERTHDFALAAATATRIEVRVVWHAVPDELAARYGIAAAPQRELASATIDLPPPGKARRRMLARAIEIPS
jgi:hypothetical protein